MYDILCIYILYLYVISRILNPSISFWTWKKESAWNIRQSNSYTYIITIPLMHLYTVKYSYDEPVCNTSGIGVWLINPFYQIWQRHPKQIVNNGPMNPIFMYALDVHVMCKLCMVSACSYICMARKRTDFVLVYDSTLQLMLICDL